MTLCWQVGDTNSLDATAASGAMIVPDRSANHRRSRQRTRPRRPGHETGRGGHPRVGGQELADADWTAEALRSGLEAAAAENGLKLCRGQAPVRVALTGPTVGLPLFEAVEVLGRERTLARIDAATAKLAAKD